MAEAQKVDLEPRPDDIVEVRITGPCTLGPGGLEKIGTIKQLRRDKAPKSATEVIRIVTRGAEPK